MVVCWHPQRSQFSCGGLASKSHSKLFLICSYKPFIDTGQFHEPITIKASSSSSHSLKRASPVQTNDPLDLILTFYELLHDDIFVPNDYTFPYLFKACRELSAIKEGRQLHTQALKRGYHDCIFVQRTLIRMYAKCGECVDASRMLVRCSEADIVSQNDLITGYVRIGELELARRVFDEMVQKNVVSWSVMVDGYAKVGQMGIAQRLFDKMPERNQFSWNSLMSGYLRLGLSEVARKLFDKMPERNEVAWTVMISGYTQNCLIKEALELFLQMQKSGVEPNRITLISILPAISQLGALSQGRWIHAYIVRKGIELDGVLGAALVDMYCKCGCMEEALLVFENLKQKEVSAWNSILSGLACHGLGKVALEIFSKMQEDSSVIPNEITFVGVLSACSHAGMVNEGRRIFELLTDSYKLIPNVRHYGCMVDLLGRAGFLEEAKEIIEKMPIEPNEVIWKTLLGACRIHKNVELAEHISRIAIDSGPQDSGFYALLYNIFEESGSWADMGKVRKAMNDAEVQKVAGCSWVEVDGIIHEFLMGGERFHPRRTEIACMVYEMERLIGLEKQALMDANQEHMKLERDF